MPSFVESFLLGVIQGLSEFLPISSSGHLSLLHLFFQFDQNFLFTVAVHFGTLLSLIIFYRKNLYYIIQNIFKPPQKNLFLKIVVASLPVMAIGFFFYNFIKNSFSHIYIVAIGFCFTGLFLIGTKFSKNYTHQKPEDKMNKNFELENISYTQALFIGISQMITLLPGISRAGISTATGIYVGVHSSLALHFSFLMGCFILLAASVLEFTKTNIDIFLTWPFTTALITSFTFGYFALMLMKSWVFQLHKFGFYLIPLGLGFLFYHFFLITLKQPSK